MREEIRQVVDCIATGGNQYSDSYQMV